MKTLLRRRRAFDRVALIFDECTKAPQIKQKVCGCFYRCAQKGTKSVPEIWQRIHECPEHRG